MTIIAEGLKEKKPKTQQDQLRKIISFSARGEAERWDTWFEGGPTQHTRGQETSVG